MRLGALNIHNSEMNDHRSLQSVNTIALLDTLHNRGQLRFIKARKRQ